MNIEQPHSRRALVVAHEVDGPGGQVAVRLAERGYDVHTHVVTADTDKPNVSVPFPGLGDYDIVALMGSIRSVTNKAEIDSWVHDELELVRDAREADVPVLGVCFGGQLIAEALGGSVELSPVTEIGWYTIDEAPGVHNPIGPGPWMEWHHDRFTPPPEATVLATTDSAVQLFTIGRMVGTQFHPEVDYAHVDHWLSTADDDYLGQYGQDRNVILAEMKANEARNIEQCHSFVDWFLDSIAFPDGRNATENTVEGAHITATGPDKPNVAERTA